MIDKVIRRNVTFVRIMSKYSIEDNYKIIKTTTLYSDGKTQVPKKIINLLKLERGSAIVWVRDGEKILVLSSIMK